MPVFLTSLSTILGAILFLRFGYAVGNVGLLGVLVIIVVGHLVTIPTAMAVAEIATNQKVEGGGEYYIISRSFGIIIGSSIGVALYLARAVSVAFYIIAFAEAFGPAFDYLRENYGLLLADKRIVSVPTLIGLSVLILTKGADLGMKMLYFVVVVLFASIALFFAGTTELAAAVSYETFSATVENPDPLFLVFAIVFPAFTGMTAGVGLSGDLRDPRTSIPLGTLGATTAGMVVYALVAVKLAVSASPQDLASDQLIMSKIALWGPIIPLGLAAATLSSAIGSYLAAPRTLQAIAGDRVFPWTRTNNWLARVRGATNEPVNAALVTSAIAFVFIWIGDVDFVAQIISMFFMITYGSICLISFLEHFAADPAYRPSFRSRWYVSLLGAVMCVWLMFQMSQAYAVLSILVMFLLYLAISYFNEDMRGLSNIVQGAIFQISRQLQVFLQKSRKTQEDSWRPSVVCISRASFERLAAFELLRWLSHRYGFGTYIHHIQGYVSRASHEQALDAQARLVELAGASRSNVYVDTMVSPSYTTAICQLVQLPGVSGKENNMVLFEFARGKEDGLADIVDNYQLVASLGFDVCILGSSARGFGYKRTLHVWVSPSDDENANLMILLAYIVLGHPDWRNGVINIFSIVPEEEMEEERVRLARLIKAGRLPISIINIELVPQEKGRDRRAIVAERSRDADLVVVGFRPEALRHKKSELFTGYQGVGNVLFVNASRGIELSKEEDAAAPEA
jgi:amino acid transporter